MKISKVGHTRTAVGKQNQEIKGMIYTSPQNERNTSDLEKYVAERNQQAQRLYAVLVSNNLKTKDKTEKIFCNQVIRYFNSMMNVLARNNKPLERKLGLMKNIRIREKKQGTERLVSELRLKEDAERKKLDVEQISGNLVDECLRNSLRTRYRIEKSGTIVYIPDIIKKVLVAFCSGSEYVRKLEQIPVDEKKALLQILEQDYKKEDQIKLIAKSIEHQKVKVQGKKEGDTCLLQLSSAENEKKKYIFSFVKQYAVSDKKERMELLLRFRRLLLLFYCGEEAYQASYIEDNKVTAWSFGYLQPENEVNISDRAMELIQEREQADKRQVRVIEDQIDLVLEDELCSRYRRCKAISEINDEDLFWLSYIQKHTREVFGGKGRLKSERLSVSYLCENTWKAWLSYIAMKYIDMGKAVYHFVLPKADDYQRLEEIRIRDVRETFQDGITSFDYERIKAQETLERDIALYVTFAVNNFARAVCDPETLQKKGREDVLLGDLELQKDAKKRIFRFWGGISQWDEAESYEDRQLAEACRQALNTIRNSTYHYAGSLEGQNYKPDGILKMLFQKEYMEVTGLYRKKYCSNNVPFFYSEGDICRMMDELYKDSSGQRPAQIPAFERIINKSNMMGFVQKLVYEDELRRLQGISQEGVMEQFKAALYFLLKEIYYYGFIQDQNTLDRLKNAVRQRVQMQSADKGERAAAEDFQNRVLSCMKEKNMTLGGICQQIMTDYHMQNQGNKEVRAAKSENKEIFQHYRMLLYVCLEEAFLEYLRDKNGVFKFLRIPVWREIRINEQELYKSSSVNLYSSLKMRMEESPDLYAWYVFARLLNPEYLNLLIGSVKGYIQYAEGIDRRSEITKNRKDSHMAKKVRRYQDIQQVLEFGLLFCGRITNELTDYFEDEEDYAECLSRFVEFEQEELSASAALKAFCKRPVEKGSPNDKIGIYYDALNPVINKHIVRAMMYGNIELLSACMEKVTEEEIQSYYQKTYELQNVFQKGSCTTRKEQERLKDFQNGKNRTELLDITIYSQILNDLAGQLVSWSYLRERDLMYFQLGIHYCRLFYSDKIAKDHRFRVLEGEGIHIQEGALLYQIAAMYTYALPVYGIDEEGQAVLPKKKGSSTGVSISVFYNDYCQRDASVYDAGLCLFENLKEHDNIVDTRDYIDHSKYFSTMSRSILELYSEVFDRFFTYDIKLKKSVSYILKNILLRYAVIIHTSLDGSREKVYQVNKKNMRKKAANIGIGKKGLKSDTYQYKIPDEKPVQIQVRTDVFLRQLERILEYKKEKK